MGLDWIGGVYDVLDPFLDISLRCEVDFDKLKDHPQLLAFGPKTRAEKLGGVPR